MVVDGARSHVGAVHRLQRETLEGEAREGFRRGICLRAHPFQFVTRRITNSEPASGLTQLRSSPPGGSIVPLVWMPIEKPRPWSASTKSASTLYAPYREAAFTITIGPVAVKSTDS